jgi:rRNA-processing protein FCF1
MILIDSNSLIVLLLGLINPKIINTHKRTSIYDEQDFFNLIDVIDIKKLVVLPNVWTEVDNLLNNFRGFQKEQYVEQFISIVKKSSEKYLESLNVENDISSFYTLGLTDGLILKLAKECEMLITSDSVLSDMAKAHGVIVYDLKELKNQSFEDNQ